MHSLRRVASAELGAGEGGDVIAAWLAPHYTGEEHD